jgi:hypothetical protein
MARFARSTRIITSVGPNRVGPTPAFQCGNGSHGRVRPQRRRRWRSPKKLRSQVRQGFPRATRANRVAPCQVPTKGFAHPARCKAGAPMVHQQPLAPPYLSEKYITQL